MKKKAILFGAIVAVLVGIVTTVTVIAINSNQTETEPEEEVVVKADSEEAVYMNKDATLSDIKKIDGVVNIYMFWGSGCPHCKAQWQWLDQIRSEYEGKVAIYGFEVFNNSENRNIMAKFAHYQGDGEVNSVPYTIIGGESFQGFTNGTTTKKILEAIKKAEKSGADIYFDKKIK